MKTFELDVADCIEFANRQPDDSIDLVFGSPPYEEARLYLENGKNLGVARKTPEWVQWMADVFEAFQRPCKGLIAFVVGHGETKGFRWSGAPALLQAELIKRGMNLRAPPAFSRHGIAGSGGPDWLRADYETIVCVTRPGKLPWSDNTACGHPPKYAPGGEMSYRLTDGSRVNQWGHSGTGNTADRRKDGTHRKAGRPSHRTRTKRENSGIRKIMTKGSPKSEYRIEGGKEVQYYQPPDLANPGNLIHCLVGGGVMGPKFCHENEAPFPEKLAEFFVLSFCPPGGVVCDPFSGSGTTMCVAVRNRRRFVGCDLRPSQVDLALKRIDNETGLLFV